MKTDTWDTVNLKLIKKMKCPEKQCVSIGILYYHFHELGNPIQALKFAGKVRILLH